MSSEEDREDRAADALLVASLLGYAPTDEEVEEFMNGPAPELTEEDKVMLEDIDEKLPYWMREWRAKEEGCLVVKDERRNRRGGSREG